MLDLYYSYYGGLICVCWSPDGKYVLTGGQDDLISIWCVAESAIVARCQGHHSWVTSVAFDPWRCDDRNYRFGSVGEDRRLCLWDFSVGMLHRPKGAAAAASVASIRHQHRGSVASRFTAGLERAETKGTTGSAGGGRLRADSSLSNGADGEGVDEKVHAVEPRARTATLPPVCVSSAFSGCRTPGSAGDANRMQSKTVDDDPLCWLEFTEDAIMTSCKQGAQLQE